MVPRRAPFHRVVVGRVVLVWLAPPQTAQTITFYGLGFSTPQTPLARAVYFGKLDLMASKWRKCEGAQLLMLVAYLPSRRLPNGQNGRGIAASRCF